MTPNLSIAALLQAYRSGTAQPRQIIREAWELAAQSDPKIWISRPEWSVVDAMLTALEARDPASLPLYGIPFGIKDNIDWAGQPTTAACEAFSYVPSKSSFVVERLIAAGAIPLGKTNLDQFATGLVGMRSPYGTPTNPFDASCIPGGSSSGSAVGVALGLVSFALGTDTAGSGRVPASFNNLIGVKPTLGLLSCTGVVPACRSLDCVSIFALTAADASAVLDVAAGYDPADPLSRAPVPPRVRDQGAPVIGVPMPDQLRFFGNQGAQALFEQSVARLKTLGWRVRKVNFQPFIDAARLLYEGPWVAERYAVAGPMIESNPEALLPVTRQIISAGAKPTAVAAFQSRYRLAELTRESEAAWDEVDAIITPTAGTIYKVEEVMAEPIALNSNLGYYTNFMNLLDLAAWAVPAGFLEGGAPWGVTFLAPAHEDRFLSSLAARFHAALDLPVGKTTLRSSEAATLEGSPPQQQQRWIKMAVCGAHMEGLPLNHQLTSRNGRFVFRGKTAPVYRLYLLPGSGKIPDRPGLVRVPEGGVALDLEVWELPEETVGSFVDAVPAPLGFGRIQLADGTNVCGFICEPIGLLPENEITVHGGWRTWLASRNG